MRVEWSLAIVSRYFYQKSIEDLYGEIYLGKIAKSIDAVGEKVPFEVGLLFIGLGRNGESLHQNNKQLLA